MYFTDWILKLIKMIMFISGHRQRLKEVMQRFASVPTELSSIPASLVPIFFELLYMTIYMAP